MSTIFYTVLFFAKSVISVIALGLISFMRHIIPAVHCFAQLEKVADMPYGSTLQSTVE